MMIIMKFRKIIDETEAVSPIIATILMVAITVIMAAIIANWSAGVKAPQQPQSVGLDISRLSQNNVTVTITSIDPPNAIVSYINSTFVNSSGNTITRTILGIGAPNQTSSPDVNTIYLSSPSQANVGDSATLYTKDYNEFIIITVRYGDGSIKTIYSQKV
jgi:flagellin-like protein